MRPQKTTGAFTKIEKSGGDILDGPKYSLGNVYAEIPAQIEEQQIIVDEESSAEREARQREEAQDEERSKWLHDIFLEHPEFLEYREIGLPLLHAHSFAQMNHTHRVMASSWFNRRVVLELIHQHLMAIGMTRTADTLSAETSCQHNSSSFQPWDQTDLRKLVSLAVSAGEDPWTAKAEGTDVYVEERVDEDFLSSTYREDPRLIIEEYQNPDLNAVYNGPEFVGGSLRRLIVHVCGSPNRDEAELFVCALPAMTSRAHFVEHLSVWMDYLSDRGRADRDVVREEKDLMFVISFLRGWLVKGAGLGFVTRAAVSDLMARSSMDERLDEKKREVLRNLLSALLRREGAKQDPVTPEKPLIPIPMALFRREDGSAGVSLTRIEPVELAKQISLIAWKKFRAIQVAEYWSCFERGIPTVDTPQLLEFFEFRDRLARLVCMTLVQNADRQVRQKAWDHWVTVADALYHQKNCDSLAVVAEVLTAGEVPQVCGAQPHSMKRIKDFTNLVGRNRVDCLAYEQWMKAPGTASIPNLGMELTWAHEAQAEEPIDFDGLFNWRRLRIGARVIKGFMDRLSHSYPFVPVLQIEQELLCRELWQWVDCERHLEECRQLCGDD